MLTFCSIADNASLFLSTAVNKGINSMVGEMKVGQKVQAIIPPELAFGEKGKTKIWNSRFYDSVIDAKFKCHPWFYLCLTLTNISPSHGLGICLENGECLVKPGATVVYDIFLKKASIPPP